MSICGRSLGISECICGECAFRVPPAANAYERAKLRMFVAVADEISEHFAVELDRVNVCFASAIAQALREKLAALDDDPRS